MIYTQFHNLTDFELVLEVAMRPDATALETELAIRLEALLEDDEYGKDS